MNAKQYREQRDLWMRRAWAAEDALKDIQKYHRECGDEFRLMTNVRIDTWAVNRGKEVTRG